VQVDVEQQHVSGFASAHVADGASCSRCAEGDNGCLAAAPRTRQQFDRPSSAFGASPPSSWSCYSRPPVGCRAICGGKSGTARRGS
jgi:hypothetical protein